MIDEDEVEWLILDTILYISIGLLVALKIWKSAIIEKPCGQKH